MNDIRKYLNYSDDSIEQLELIYELVKKTNNLNGDAVIEIGTRKGGSSMVIMDAMGLEEKHRFFITVDPYGDKPYPLDTKKKISFDYGEHHYKDACMNLAVKSLEIPQICWTHFRVRSQDFIDHLGRVQLFLKGEKYILNRDFLYSFVYLDGEHNTETVKKEIEYFFPRICEDGYILIDNSDQISIKQAISSSMVRNSYKGKQPLTSYIIKK